MKKMQIDFSQVDTSVIDRMALFMGILAADCLLLPLLVGGMLKVMRMPFSWCGLELCLQDWAGSITGQRRF
ncbi:hypothetical protein FK545_20860 (plasmid) [Planococcus glaciei]|nr:hypothetical protein [Planococcus glaciei]QDY47025.1 hypothetical protein FK545_20860 [Planococcus glaciei]